MLTVIKKILANEEMSHGNCIFCNEDYTPPPHFSSPARRKGMIFKASFSLSLRVHVAQGNNVAMSTAESCILSCRTQNKILYTVQIQ